MLSLTIEKLLAYAKIHLYLPEIDELYVRNLLMNKLHVSYPYKGEIDTECIKKMLVPDALLDELRQDLKDVDFINEENIELFLTDIMGVISPRPSEVVRKFNSFENKQDAFDYLYDLSIKNNYIQKTAVDKNIYWDATYDNKQLEISINLSKPEKKNSDIKKLLSKSSSSSDKYPDCVLCKENLGFAGNATHAARQNLRFIPLDLDGRPWFVQYSPYVYYYQHCIVIDSEHKNMTMGKEKFRQLISFVDQFPCFFIGSNSELPIVGGSILNHEHFQGGNYLLPLVKAKDKFEIPLNGYPHCKLTYVDFFNSTLKIESSDKEQIIELMDAIYTSWKNYDDLESDIISYDENGYHNTVTPIVRKVNDKYIAFLILRNNRTSEEHPDGIFHAHRQYHNIKQEGIGLIEAAGLYILPARLKRQLGIIERMLCDSSNIEAFIDKNKDYEIHRQYIFDLIARHGRDNSPEQAHNIVIESINEICGKILENTAVFKHNEHGDSHLLKFTQTIQKR